MKQMCKVMADILIVEDDIFIAQMLELRLKLQGHTVHLARDGKEGAEKALRLLPKLVLMDMHMPMMNGMEAVAHLRSKHYKGTIASLSAAARAEDIETALQAGCDATITKPIGPDFEDTITRLLEVSHR